MRFQLVTPPTGEVVPLERIKSDLRIESTDFDADLRSWIAVAVEHLQDATRRQLLTATWRLLLDRFPREIKIWKAPVSSVTSIQYLDAAGTLQTLSSDAYVVSQGDEPKRITLVDGYSWPTIRTDPDAVRVTFVAGYGTPADVPEMARGLIKILVRNYYEKCLPEPEKVEPLMNRLRWSNGYETEVC